MLYYDDGGSLVPSCLFSCPERECWFVESLKKTIIMKTKFTKALPKIVSAAEWQIARDRLLAKEKAHTRAGDALAAERRRLPMVEISKAYQFDSTNGKATTKMQLPIRLFSSSPCIAQAVLPSAPAR